ncbi:MAG: hypothetical protein KKD64_05775 [Alphaproteobacteria bacterium]|nr:hypothetical protein [Alphaproteobacteria bacterium]MBU0794211.1 hypothetical protein [Alphaproteobacteria bacterium]MBU0876022.1 hypothetical protein [Alphaproteobacteria bacterium]MBU1769145.1 hypothetical protein [Alphaproteobacteria bacterium]
MRMFRLVTAPVLALGLCWSAPLLAQAKPAAPTQAQLQHAAENFRIMVSALQSDKVPQAVKSILFTCSYSNPFSKISEGTDKLIADKKLDRKNPTQVLSAMAAVCGFRPEMANPPKK